MRKYILVESEIANQTPFRHFSDLSNLNNIVSMGVAKIVDFEQIATLFKHNKLNRDFFLNSDNKDLYIESFRQKNKVKIDLEHLTDLIDSGKCKESWITCGYIISNNRDTSLENLKFWYRCKESLKLKDCFTHEILNQEQSFITDTLFFMHGFVRKAPVYHILLNDDTIFDPGSTVDSDRLFVNTVNFHDGTFAEFLLKPLLRQAFVVDNVIIAPKGTFIVDFYARAGFKYVEDFPFELLGLKIRSNIEHKELDTGVYQFDMKDQDYGYIYARINTDFGGEQEKSTTLRVAYSVHNG